MFYNCRNNIIIKNLLNLIIIMYENFYHYKNIKELNILSFNFNKELYK